MDWKTFFSTLVDTIAWPAVVIFIVYAFRDKLGELLPRVKRVKHKDTELEFAEKINELAKEVDTKSLDIPAETAEFAKQFDFLVKLSDISPRSAILEAFRLVESEAAKTITRTYPDLDLKQSKPPLQAQRLLKGKVLDKNRYYQFDQLRILRNKAAHMEDFDLLDMPIETYIDLALSLARYLANQNQ